MSCSAIVGVLYACALSASGSWQVMGGDPVADGRLSNPRETNHAFTMTPFETREEWAEYAPHLRRRVLIASGLWPLPEKTPLNARVFDTVEHEGYTVSKVYFEAYPGFLVTGNLYMPDGDGPFPGIVNPHGHWEKGRLEDSERGSVPARCITIARMGIVAFSYDMVGYNDSSQFSQAWGHRGGSVRKSERKRLQLWGIHPFALQLWSSIRAIDFLQGLPQVDADRIGCTGASGGGTQTFALSAVDDRVKVAAPVNMISHSMQGGCVCENAPLIRIDASNMEIGALFAPKPLLMVSATGDWTTKTPEVEYPAIRGIYGLHGVEEKISNVHVDAPHNFNLSSREAVYGHFARWLLNDGEFKGDISEGPYEIGDPDALRVFPDGAVAAGFPDAKSVTESLIESARSRALVNIGNGSIDRDALGDVLGMSPMRPLRVSVEARGVTDEDGYRVERHVVRVANTGAAIPVLRLIPDSVDYQASPVLIVHGEGKQMLMAESGSPVRAVRKLLNKGRTVIVVDVFGVGESNASREKGDFHDTFVPTDTAFRVQDILAVIEWQSQDTNGDLGIELQGLDEAGLWCMLASAMDERVTVTEADLNGFDPNDDAQWVERHYIPSIRSLGDIELAKALIAPRKLTVRNSGSN